VELLGHALSGGLPEARRRLLICLLRSVGTVDNPNASHYFKRVCGARRDLRFLRPRTRGLMFTVVLSQLEIA
jgi:hypothetical protein